MSLQGQTVPLPTKKESDDLRSLAYYESILQKNPELAEARFGAGYAAYKQEDFQRALSEFEAALGTKDRDLKSKTFYNLANTLNRQGKLNESMQAYRKALELNPNDPDAKYNYEFTRRMMQQHPSPQPQPSEDNQVDDGSEQQQQSKKESGQGESEDQEQEEGEGPPSQESPTEQQENPKESQVSQSKESGKKPDAQSILDALKADEKNLMKRQLSPAQSKQLEKEW